MHRKILNKVRFPALLLIFIVSNSLQASWQKQSRDIMGTRVTVEMWSENPQQSTSCTEQVFSEMHRIDALMSPYIATSEVAKINQFAAQKPVSVSKELIQLIKKSLYFSALSAGAFDITFASIGFQYDYRQQKKPDDETIRQQLDSINYQNLQISQNTLKFKHAGMSIDLGGIAKGYAVDNAIQILKQCGIQQAMVSAGGDSRILGDKRGRPWMIGIQHPRKQDAIALSIPLNDSAISTSGDYERYFLSNNERIHHIINPATGKSAHKSWSVTIIGADATTTDALSTTVFILGTKKGLKLINSLENIDAIIIDSHGIVHYSTGLETPERASENNS